MVGASWNVMAHAQKPSFVVRRNWRVHLNWRGPQFSRLLAAEVCASAVVMLDTPCSKVVWKVLATHSIRQFPFYFPSIASPCAITFQLESTEEWVWNRCQNGRMEDGRYKNGETRCAMNGLCNFVMFSPNHFCSGKATMFLSVLLIYKWPSAL
jgi:hypothetical protein